MSRRTSLAVVKGNPGRRPLKPAVKAAAGPLAPPAHLSAAARREWRRIVGEASRVGLISTLDTAVFCLYCESVGEERAYAAQLAALPSVLTTLPSGYQQVSPLIGLRRKAALDTARYASLLGFAVTKRAGMDLVSPLAPAPNPTDRFF